MLSSIFWSGVPWEGFYPEMWPKNNLNKSSNYPLSSRTSKTTKGRSFYSKDGSTFGLSCLLNFQLPEATTNKGKAKGRWESYSKNLGRDTVEGYAALVFVISFGGIRSLCVCFTHPFLYWVCWGYVWVKCDKIPETQNAVGAHSSDSWDFWVSFWKKKVPCCLVAQLFLLNYQTSDRWFCA